MCSPSPWQTLLAFCQSLLETLVAVVVSMVPPLIATDGSAPHKPINAFLSSVSFLPSGEHREAIGVCWQFSSLAVNKNISKYKVAFAVLWGVSLLGFGFIVGFLFVFFFKPVKE